MAGDDALCDLSVRDAARLIAGGAITSEALVSDCLARLTAQGAKAFPQLQSKSALGDARIADERRRSGLPLAPLHGVPIAITVDLAAADPAAKVGSSTSPDREPAPVAALRAAGAVIVGPAADTDCAAAAVAMGCVPAAIGVETTGSLTASASRAGCFAFKPSYGLVPRSDVRLSAPSLDTIGILARTAPDLAVVTDTIQSYDSGDGATAARFRPPLLATATMDWPLAPRFAFVPMRAPAMSDATLREAFGELLEALGPDVMTIDIEPLIAHGDAAANAVAAFELAHQLTSLRGVPPTANAGEEPSAEKYARALGARQELLAVLGGVFVDHGTILMQAAPLVAVSAAGEPAKVWTYLGLPTISVPLLECAGQPCGVMLVGASGDDGRLLRTARLLGEQIARLA